MNIRNRIKELRYVRAEDLKPSPWNWREHPPSQRDALRGVLAEVGIAGAVLARELEDGSLELIDGHARAEVAPETEWPVLVLDVDEREAKYILATHDPLGAMATAGAEALSALLQDVSSGNNAVQEMLAGIYQMPEPKTAPEDFAEVGDDLPTDHVCPKCGYRWSGGE